MAPDVPAQSIQNMLPQRTAGGKFRMIEVIREIVRHADTFHDGDRPPVALDRERNDLIKL